MRYTHGKLEMDRKEVAVILLKGTAALVVWSVLTEIAIRGSVKVVDKMFD